MRSANAGYSEPVDGFLLVDDRDGRVLAELDDLESAFQALEDCDDPELAEARCIVRFDERHGALVGTESTTRVHLLT